MEIDADYVADLLLIRKEGTQAICDIIASERALKTFDDTILNEAYKEAKNALNKLRFRASDMMPHVWVEGVEEAKQKRGI